MTVNASLNGAEIEALLELVRTSKWVVWTEGRESRIADMVLRALCDRQLASIERVNATTHAFRITPAGRAALGENDSA